MTSLHSSKSLTCESHHVLLKLASESYLLMKRSLENTLLFFFEECLFGLLCASKSMQNSHGCILKHGQTCCRQLLHQLGQGGLHQRWPASRSCPHTEAITTTSSSSTIVANAMAGHLAGSSSLWLKILGGRPFNRSLWPLGEQACLLLYRLPRQLPNTTGQLMMSYYPMTMLFHVTCSSRLRAGQVLYACIE